MVDSRAIVMGREELAFWSGIRRRGAFWFLVHKGLLFLIFYPLLGHLAAGWAWEPGLFLEAWLIGVVCGGFVWMRKELRYRYTLEHEGPLVPDLHED